MSAFGGKADIAKSLGLNVSHDLLSRAGDVDCRLKMSAT